MGVVAWVCSRDPLLLVFLAVFVPLYLVALTRR